jgi:hypothetical protein
MALAFSPATLVFRVVPCIMVWTKDGYLRVTRLFLITVSHLARSACQSFSP